MTRAEEGRRGGAGRGGRGGWGGRCDAPPEGGADRVGREARHGHVEPLRGPAEPELLEVVVARGDQFEHGHVLQLHQVQRRQTELEELVHHDDPQRRGGAGACEVEGGGVRGHWPAHRRARLVLPLGRVPQQVRQHQRAVEHRSPCCGVAQRDELVRVAKLRRVEQVALVIGAGSGGMRRTCTRQSVGKAGRDRAQVHHPPATGEWAARQENEGQEQQEHEEPPRVLRRRRPALWLGRPREGLIDGSSSCGHPHHAREAAVLGRRRRQQSVQQGGVKKGPCAATRTPLLQSQLLLYLLLTEQSLSQHMRPTSAGIAPPATRDADSDTRKRTGAAQRQVPRQPPALSGRDFRV